MNIYKYIETSINKYQITMLNLYNNPKLLLNKETPIHLRSDFEREYINIKVYSLVYNIRNINLPNGDLQKSFISNVANLNEMYYEYMNYEIKHFNNYEILKPQLKVILFCKYVILLLDNMNKLKNETTHNRYFCFGSGDRHNIPNHLCIENCNLTLEENKHMKKIHDIANFMHNYPAITEDIKNLYMYVTEDYGLDEEEKRYMYMYKNNDFYNVEFQDLRRKYDKKIIITHEFQKIATDTGMTTNS